MWPRVCECVRSPLFLLRRAIPPAVQLCSLLHWQMISCKTRLRSVAAEKEKIMTLHATMQELWSKVGDGMKG